MAQGCPCPVTRRLPRGSGLMAGRPRWRRRATVIRRRSGVGIVLAGLWAAAVTSPARPAPPADLAGGRWRLEAIELVDGRRLEGLVLAGDAGVPGPNAADVVLLQILQPPGRPLHLIAWPPFPADTVRLVERLATPAHDELQSRVEAFRAGQRRREEASAVRLLRHDEDGPWRYEGQAFTLESTADPTLTRESVVLLELVLEALTALVPPVVEAGPCSIRLCGSLAEYRRAQEDAGLWIDNPAFYLRPRRLLVAGSELSALAAQRETADDVLDAASQAYATLDAVLETRIRRLAEELEARGMPDARRAEVVQAARLRWQRERRAERSRIESAHRDNAAAVARTRRRFDARLAHEAWHAYADGRLRRPDSAGLPAWLDEGLAQIVETAPVEAGEIRLDAPDPPRLARLQELLRSGAVPPIADVLTSGQSAFLAGHDGDDRAVAYLMAWGLALDLAIVRPVLSRQALAGLTAAGETDPLDRFEAIVGMPVDEYDRRWRQRMVSLRPAAATPTTGAVRTEADLPPRSDR